MTRASMKWSLDLLEHVADNGHMDALAIVDTMGVLAPHTVPYLVKAVKARIPGKPVELHFHDDYGLGAANTIMAWPPARMWPILPSVPWASGPATHPMKMWCCPC